MKKWTSVSVSLIFLFVIILYYLAPQLDPELQLFGAKPHHWVHKINVLGGIGLFIALTAISVVITYRSLTRK